MIEKVDFEKLAEEMRFSLNMQVVLRPESAFALAGLVQLALRHPDIGKYQNVVPVGRDFIAACREHFRDCPQMRKVLSMGNPEANGNGGK